MLPRYGRTYHDPLHGAIALDQSDPTESLLIHLIDTPVFQRLRRIRQLGSASLTFHGAEASRFTHSLGVMAIARRAFDRIARHYPQLQPYRAPVLCAALLHDIGHGPFSHTCEDIFGSHHEHWTLRLLSESDSIRTLLDAFSPELVDHLHHIFLKTHPIPFVWQLVSSQLDCDRLDYLMRDSYFTGASYGRLDLDRILMAMRYDPDTQTLVVAHKGLAAIEHYLIVRYFMYAQVYNHPKNLAAVWVLEQAFKRARELLTLDQLPADEVVSSWLQHDCDRLPLDLYLDADDGIFLYHLQRWQKHPDSVLSNLCQRFINRDLLKALDVTHLDGPQQEALLDQVYCQLQKYGWNHQYYAGLRTTLSRGYTLYQKGINLQTDTSVQEISHLSPLVKTLTHSCQRHWLLYPREINAALLI
ncbi:MAG TPA: HD domain-containing protein [Elainellaceae cyanobacterium]